MMERRCLYELEFLVRDYECDMEGIYSALERLEKKRAVSGESEAGGE